MQCLAVRHGITPTIPSHGERPMRILAGVDWSDEAFAAVEQIGLLYRPDEVVLIHGVDLGVLTAPMMAGTINMPGYDDLRQGLMDAGRQAIERCRTLLPTE